jgi:hypothetical protein
MFSSRHLLIIEQPDHTCIYFYYFNNIWPYRIIRESRLQYYVEGIFMFSVPFIRNIYCWTLFNHFLLGTISNFCLIDISSTAVFVCHFYQYVKSMLYLFTKCLQAEQYHRDPTNTFYPCNHVIVAYIKLMYLNNVGMKQLTYYVFAKVKK